MSKQYKNDVTFLESLGYTVNYKKSVLVPTQRIIFFGFILDSVQFKIFLTEEKVQKIKTKAQSLLNTGLVVVREVASFIGLIINAFHAVLEAPMYYRSLERDKIVGLGENHDFNNMVILSDNSTKELNCWKHNVAIKNGKRVRPDKVQLRCRTDAKKVSNGAKIRNRYNQVPHLTQDTNGKVTNSPLILMWTRIHLGK